MAYSWGKAPLLNQLESNLRQGNYDFVSLLTARDSSAESFYLKRNYQRDRKIVLLNLRTIKL